MKGSARLLCAALGVLVLTLGSHADKPTKNNKNIKKFVLHPNAKGPFGPVPLPPVPPFRFAPFKKTASPSLDPYACLPKYMCIVQNKKGEKRTTIVHGLHPALRKTKPDVIDPLNLPSLPALKRPLPLPLLSTDGSDDDLFRDREFDDSFLKQQEMAETMAYIEEKRRQFMYHQGLPKQTIIPKKGKKKTEESKKSEESAEDEEEEKSKEEELSKEDKEEEKSKDEQEEVSKEEKESDKSVEEKEEESAEEESLESNKSQAKLSKYKIKKKLYSQNRKDFKTRMDTDEYDDVDTLNDHIVTVPWDDRVKNDSDPLKPSEIYDKLFGKVLPSFQLPKLPKIAKSIPGMSYFTSAGSEEVTTTTTQRPGLLRRMLMVATGSGPSNTIRKHNSRPVRRFRRDTDEEDDDDDDVKLTSMNKNDEIILKQIRDPARQCRMIFKGCDLPYEHIMKMVSSGQVLIENDQVPQTTTRKPVHDPTTSQDDEYEQAMKDRMAPKKSKPIPQLLAQASLGGKKKVKGPAGLPIFGKNKKRPASFESDEVFGGYNTKPKISIASLPLRPMKYQWGKPTYTVNGEPTYSSGAPDFSGGIFDPNAFKPAQPQPTTTTTTTTERPIFASIPLDPKNNHSVPVTHSVIQVNKTHAVHVLSKKPYNPVRTRTRDAKGNPLSFSTVFTEIAGNSGGIHDFFDRISGAFGGDGQESGREFPAFPEAPNHGHIDNSKLPASPHAKPTAFPSAPIPPDEFSKDGDDDDAHSAERNDDDDDDSDEEPEDDNNEEEEGDGEEEEEDDDNNDEEEDEPADDVAVPEAVQKQKPAEKPQTYLETNPDSYIGVGPIEKKPGSYTVAKKNKNKDKPAEIKKPVKEEEEDEDEETEDDVEEGEENQEGDEQMDLPENVPAFIKQSMIEDMKRKKAEAEKEGADDDGEEDEEGGEGQPGPGGPQQFGGQPGQGPQQYGGRPGQGGHLPQHQQGGPHQPPRQGGLFSSLFSG